jgi:hypothetical protein
MPYSKADKLSTHLYTTSSYVLFILRGKSTQDDVRLACVKHLDSVQSEPSSNSSPFHFQLSMLLFFLKYRFSFDIFFIFLHEAVKKDSTRKSSRNVAKKIHFSIPKH